MNSRTIPAEGAEDSLQDQLRAATRPKHHDLNTQIITRLPLCLPPHANSPLKYAKGMVVFGQIYFSFERCHATPLDCSDPRMIEMYRTIYLPQLSRTTQLQCDIASLKSRLSLSEAEELESIAEASRDFGRRIEASLAARPHVLLAYTYTMYLALFNGGRWIRGRLLASGNEFWLGKPSPLSFWELDDQQHAKGDDEILKDRFKIKFSAAASQLTADEQRDVVKEAVRLFDLCSDMVAFLDEKTTATSSASQTCPVVPSGIDSAGFRTDRGTGTFTATVWIGIASTCAMLKAMATTIWIDRLATPS